MAEQTVCPVEGCNFLGREWMVTKGDRSEVLPSLRSLCGPASREWLRGESA